MQNFLFHLHFLKITEEDTDTKGKTLREFMLPMWGRSQMTFNKY